MGQHILSDEEIGRGLVVELLAYQFASPVRWIETQDTLLNDGLDPVQRIIEIGPAAVLSGLAKRTAAVKYDSAFEAKDMGLQIFSTAKDFDQICYEYEPEVDELSEDQVQTSPTEEIITPASTIPPSPQVPSPASSLPVPILAPLEDSPVPAILILHVIVALKLQQQLAAVSTGKSIAELSKGKSTLQNEIIGDLGAEFGVLPDGPESLSLTNLADAIQRYFNGSAGKISSQSLSRFLSTKIPAGFGTSAIRDYLKSKWRLEAGRQTGVLLLALVAAPAARLTDISAAQEFLDESVKRYGTYVGMELAPVLPGQATQQSTQAQGAIDSASLKKLQADQNGVFRKQYDALAKHLGLDQAASNHAYDETITALAEKEAESTKINAELGHVYLAGITPVFDPRKERLYDSAWNWARQDLFQVIEGVKCGRKTLDDQHTQAKLTHVLNAAEPPTLKLLDYLCKASEPSLGVALDSRFSAFRDTLQESFIFGPRYRYKWVSQKPVTTVDDNGVIKYSEIPRETIGESNGLYTQMAANPAYSTLRLSIAPCLENRMSLNADELTQTLHQSLRVIGDQGLPFTGLIALVTGAGPQSIGIEIVRGILEGGGTVIATTSKSPEQSAHIFQQLYASHGGRCSRLHVVQVNQGSSQDCKALIDHIYDKLGLDIDVLVPFAAISEAGRMFDDIDGKSELAHRLMLTNIIRLIGHVKRQKQAKLIQNKPAQVIVPLSPNHGIFGADGLYSESKIGLHTLYNRWYSESMSAFISICGAEIGWTRATGLMSANDITASAIESANVLTFSQQEMACNILALLSEDIRDACTIAPIHADLTGGLTSVPDLKMILTKARRDLNLLAKTKALIASDRALDDATESTKPSQRTPQGQKPLANILFDFPDLPRFDDLRSIHTPLKDMVDLSRVPVVVGFSELGPWGNARTRWQMEVQHRFSLEGWVEIAWIMGLIKHSNGSNSANSHVGWVDAKTNDPVLDSDIESIYSQQILEHTGIRRLEPQLFEGYDPAHKEFLQELVLEEDMPPFEASLEDANAFKDRHGDKAQIHRVDETITVTLKKGAVLLNPKSIPFTRQVAGQLPTGWKPSTYGIPEDISKSIDPVTLYVLCAVSEAFLSAGITDPWELWQHIHVSELANCLGSAFGGSRALRRMFQQRYMQKEVQSDILQETFVNTTPAWVNMLLLGASGPIKSPVGACATALESVDLGIDSLLRGSAKFAITGGADDFSEESSQEFANMGATVDSMSESAAGRLPHEMSRPTATSRSGFVQAHGAGVQLITTAELALSMGLPIYSVVAYSAMASDKISRSVPAPGKGLLVNARESTTSIGSPLLNIAYRRERKEAVEAQICQSHADEVELLDESGEFAKAHQDALRRTTLRQMRDARFTWGNDFARHDLSISPIRAALATWNLTIDDIAMVSMHGTSTKANDTNEAEMIATQFAHLGRSPGNAALVVCQKGLTGHSIGAAGAWMLNGAIQAQQSGIVPGNRNADNVETQLAQWDSLLFPSQSLKTAGLIKAVSITSFGFGQKGAQVITVHPVHLFASLSGSAEYARYVQRTTQRRRQAYTYWHNSMLENSIFKAKSGPQYDQSQTSAVLLDPTARLDDNSGMISSIHSGRRPRGESPSVDRGSATSAMAAAVSELHSGRSSKRESLLVDTSLANGAMAAAMSNLASHGQHPSFGVDMEDIAAFTRHTENEVFIERNFTPAERSYARSSTLPGATFCGRWCAKEAVFKSLRHPGQGAGASLKDIEIVDGVCGPTVKLHGLAKSAAEEKGIKEVRVSVSHCDSRTIAIAAAFKHNDLTL